MNKLILYALLLSPPMLDRGHALVESNPCGFTHEQMAAEYLDPYDPNIPDPDAVCDVAVKAGLLKHFKSPNQDTGGSK